MVILNPNSAQFLTEEYTQLKTHYLANEELGDKKVNLLLTIVTAVMGTLGVLKFGNLTPSINSSLYLVLLIAATLSSLLFGLFTFARIIQRNKNSNKIKHQINKIVEFFETNDPSLSGHLVRETISERQKKWRDLVSFQNGGLATTIMLLDSMIVSTLFGLGFVSIESMKPNPDQNLVLDIGNLYVGSILVGFGSFISSYVVHFAYMKWKYLEKPKLWSSKNPSKTDERVVFKIEVPYGARGSVKIKIDGNEHQVPILPDYTGNYIGYSLEEGTHVVEVEFTEDKKSKPGKSKSIMQVVEGRGPSPDVKLSTSGGAPIK